MGRKERWLSGFAAASLLLLAGALCITRITDTDLWWHLAAGDRIRLTGHVPSAEPFSYTALGRRWIDVHWLFQWGLSWLHAHGGMEALQWARIAIVAGLFGFLLDRARRSAGMNAAVAITLAAVLAAQERFLLRPEIVSWVFLAVDQALLERALRPETGAGRRRVILWAAIPLLQILWVNVQALFILGPVLVALAVLAACVPPFRSDRAADLLGGLALAAAACLVNPFGALALRLPFDLFFGHLGGTSLLSRTIAEFRPPFSGYAPTPAIAAFALLLGLAALAIATGIRRAPPFDVLVAVAFLVPALRGRRNIALFAVAIVPILARRAPAVTERLGAAWRRLRGGAAAVPEAAAGREPAGGAAGRSAAAVPILLAGTCLLVLALTVTNVLYLHPPTERWYGFGTISWYFPDEAARFVEGAGIPGQAFHPLAMGGFLIHAWEGKRLVFIDGRNDPYLDDVLETYLEAVADPVRFEETVQRYRITAVLWPHQRAIEGRALLAHLARSGSWRLVYLDPAAAVYARVDPQIPFAVEADPSLQGIDRREVYAHLLHLLEAQPFAGPPIREAALAEYFAVAGDPAGAEFFYRRAIERLPRSAPLLQWDPLESTCRHASLSIL